ncbi:MAG: hypothetical protein LBC85_02550, partial [Fibromonadaceae bacterium]|nr:hypothetical protein [Fibromonadaceae bacterium]
NKNIKSKEGGSLFDFTEKKAIKSYLNVFLKNLFFYGTTVETSVLHSWQLIKAITFSYFLRYLSKAI